MTDQMRAALVTGGACRIGRAIVRALHQSGHAVAIHAQQAMSDAEALRDEIARAHGRAAVVPADLSDRAAVTGLIGAATRAVGPLRLLVNIAAGVEPGELDAVEPTHFDRQFAVSLRAPLLLAQAFAQQAAEGASIVNVLDPLLDPCTMQPSPHVASYMLAQSALQAATRTLAQALAPAVRVNAVVPARLPEEIAAAVVYLAGARSVTGVTLRAGDGQHPSNASITR